MFLHARWTTSNTAHSRSLRIRTAIAIADVELAAGQGRGELAVHVRVDPSRGYTNPRRYSAVGVLLAVVAELPQMEGENSVIRLMPLPPDWDGIAVSVFEKAGFVAVLMGQSLELSSALGPRDAIEGASVVAFALDGFSRTFAGELMAKARSIAGRFGDYELCGLLDEHRGAYRLRRLFNQVPPPVVNEELRGAITSALKRIETEQLVHFHCGGDTLLHRIATTLPLKTVIGVEPSAQRASRSPREYKLIHGSLVDPPSDLPAEATALVVDALPERDDLRRTWASELLFRSVGFEWVFCIEHSRHLREWGKKVAAEYGYRVASWDIGKAHAVLFRRVPGSAGRTGVSANLPQAVNTRLAGPVGIQPHQWAATVETFSRLTVDPRWLCYLPVSALSLPNQRTDGELEPLEAVLNYYRNEGIDKVVVEGKPLASRAVVLVCREGESKRFGMRYGSVYTRKGKPFFEDADPVLARLSAALTRARFWEKFRTDWVAIECDVIPWALKAGKLLDDHAELLRAGEALYSEAERVLGQLSGNGSEAVAQGRDCLRKHRSLYEALKADAEGPPAFAPVCLIATEGATYFDRSQLWHMETLSALSRKAVEPFVEVPFTLVRLSDAAAVGRCLEWREALIASGAEGVVVKPLPFLPKGRRGLAHPALMSRGREHLRLVYGPEYDRPEERLLLRERETQGGDRAKQRIIRQLALSIEAAERFVRNEPTESVIQCLRGSLALETKGRPSGSRPTRPSANQ